MSTPLKVLAIVLTAAAGAFAATGPVFYSDDRMDLVTVAAGSLSYRVAGEFLHEGTPVNAPLVVTTFDRPITIMKRQVSDGEYQTCVRAGACKAVASSGATKSLPVVGVSFIDAKVYADWLSRTAGHQYRLPTDAEWAYVAATRFHDGLLADDGDAANPAKRWLLSYELEAAAAEKVLDVQPHTFGTFGTNENGLNDIAGNVWEWTTTCFVRHVSAMKGNSTLESCGVRVVEGRHRTHISDFIRDPRGGACSVGAPPSNLGMRLVRDDVGFVDRLAASVRYFLRLIG